MDVRWVDRLTMIFKEIYTTDQIKELLKKDDIYLEVTQCDLDNWTPANDSYWFECFEDNEAIGILMLRKESQDSISFHAGIYKDQRGNGFKHCRSVVDMLHKGHPEWQIWTKTMEYNEPARRILERLGFAMTGYIPNAKDGKKMIIYSEIK